MKAKFLLLLLVTLLVQTNITSFAGEMKSARQIRLSLKTKVPQRSVPELPIAVIENSLLSVDLLSLVTTVTTTIKDAETGEVVYTSTETDVEKLVIDLTGEEAGKYILEIESPLVIYTGEFDLE